jgi:endoglucanase
MKRPLVLFIAILAILVLFMSCRDHKPVGKEVTTPYTSFKIKKGTNIAHWLSQSDKRGAERASFFTEKDIIFIDSVGMYEKLGIALAIKCEFINV